MEINLALGAALLQQKPIGGVRFELLGPGVGQPGAHPWNLLAVQDTFDGRDIGVGDQMPQGRREFVGCQSAEQNYLDRRELVPPVEQEGNRVNLGRRTFGLYGPGLGNELNTRTINPVGEEVNVNAGQKDGQDGQHGLLGKHAYLVTSREATYSSQIQPISRERLQIV